MRYKAVLFDMDGTTLDTVEDLKDAANVTLERFGFPSTDSHTAEQCLGNGSLYYLSHLAPEGTPQETIDEMLSFYKPYYDTHCCIKTRPYAGILPLIEKLRLAGIKTVIISNKPDTAVRELAKKYFPGIRAVGERGGIKRKPAPDMVFAELEALDMEAGDCVYVGDTEVDILTAQNAGMDSIAVDWGFRSREQLISSGAGIIAESPHELYELITGEI